MKNTFLYMLIVFCICSCKNSLSTRIDELLIIDSVAHIHHSLHQFTSFDVSRKQINNIPICDFTRSQCRPGEKPYKIVLKDIGFSVKAFDSLVNSMSKLGFKKYYRHENYSVWVEGGALGDVYGYLINHDPLAVKIKSFQLDSGYHIGVGNQVRENVFYFSSNIR